MQQQATEILDHAARGRDWLIDQQQPTGNWENLPDPKLEAFYKGSWTFAQNGEPVAAHRTLNYIRNNLMTDEGDFAPRAKDVHESIQHVYSNSYVITGSMLMGRYEIARPAVDFLLSRQDPASGGFYSQRGVEGRESNIDTMSTGSAGVACLAAGELEAAERAGEFLGSMLEQQPNPDSQFFTTRKLDGELLTDVAEEREAYQDIDWFRLLETNKPDQCWYAMGLPFAFLVRLWLATGKDEFRDSAQRYYDFQSECIDPWTGGSSGKAGWGSSILFRETGEDRYRETAETVADYIISRQNSDGSWYKPDEEGNYDNGSFDASAEFTLWLSLIGTNLRSANV